MSLLIGAERKVPEPVAPIREPRFDVVSYGEERSVDRGTTEAAYVKNRRDDFVITVGGDSIRLRR